MAFRNGVDAHGRPELIPADWFGHEPAEWRPRKPPESQPSGDALPADDEHQDDAK